MPNLAVLLLLLTTLAVTPAATAETVTDALDYGSATSADFILPSSADALDASDGSGALDDSSPQSWSGAMLASGGLFCEGHAYKPYYTSQTYESYVTFSSMQKCSGGDFIGMYNCIRAQQKDSSGKWYNRTVWKCNPYTVSKDANYNLRSWSCTDLEYGTFRTRLKSVIDTTKGTFTRYASSYAATLC